MLTRDVLIQSIILMHSHSQVIHLAHTHGTHLRSAWQSIVHVVLQLWVMGLLDQPDTSSGLGDADRDLYASASSPYLL